MKEGIHPKYEQTTIRCACGNVFTTGSTKKDIRVEICSKCHPFYTGKQKLVDTGGRVDRFNKKFGGQLAEIIREINRQGITVLLIEQNANMALKTADWAYVMQTGTILMQGEGKELLENEEVKAAYLGKAK